MKRAQVAGRKRGNQKDNFYVSVQGRSLEVQRIPGRGGQASELVFLHEGLGSVSHWKDFPARVADATGSPVTVYSRYGCGNSDVLTEPRDVRYMHDEALHTLPDLLAPHVFVEDLSVASIAEAKTRFETTDLPEKLARYHRDAARTFWGWNRIWLHPDFRRWNIDEYLPRITCPIVAIQGLDDQYGSMAQVRAIARQAGGPVQILPLAECRHSPQRDHAEATVGAIAKFVKQIGEQTGS